MMTKNNYLIDDVEDLKEILSEIDDINAPVNKNLATLLHLCCIMSCDTAPIEYLLEKGANPHIKDKFGLTAFDYAIRNPNQWARILNYIALK
ncbi:MAG: ankyrin repeat domain-containing protein [Alphaproteobacteria bacterium]|nr:ankyrin repeat domain-containing protein [Alphaproteobacteria bacterium]